MIFFNICVYIIMDITSYTRSRLRTVVCGFMVIPVLVTCALWIFSWINMVLVLGSRPRKLMFPQYLDRRDRRSHHMGNLLGDRVPNVMAG